MFVGVFSISFYLASGSIFALLALCCHSMAAYLDVEELALENDYMRVSPDPSISVGDLEAALEAYFKKVGYRNAAEVVEAIEGGKCTWKTSPKAVA